MTQSSKGKDLIKSSLTVFVLFYLFFSVSRFFMYDELILSTNIRVLVISSIFAVLSIVNTMVKPLLHNNKKQKKYRSILKPLSSLVVAYIILTLISYGMSQASIFSNHAEVLSFSIMFGIIEVVSKKIDKISPRNPETEPNKPLKYYTNKYIIHASPFHKLMLFIYGFCIVLIVSLIIFMN